MRIARSPAVRRALRWTMHLAALALAEGVLAVALGRWGIALVLLSPTGALGPLLAALAGLVLLSLRLIRVVLAPPLVVGAWCLALGDGARPELREAPPLADVRRAGLSRGRPER
jgi:hypothetical protein